MFSIPTWIGLTKKRNIFRQNITPWWLKKSIPEPGRWSVHLCSPALSVRRGPHLHGSGVAQSLRDDAWERTTTLEQGRETTNTGFCSGEIIYTSEN